MGTSDGVRYGPFVLGPRVAHRRDLELRTSTYFGPDGIPREALLRRTRPCADGANEHVLTAAGRYALLHHPSVVPVIDFGALEGRTYVATERVRGHNLLRVLGRCGQKKVGFPTDVALYVMQCILHGLEHAHRAGTGAIVHGDLCHTNVLVGMDGAVRVSDFGLGAVSTRKRTPRGLHIGVGRGYSAYRAPELWRGAEPSPASDLFAAGVILYELTTGHVLFGASKEDPLIERLERGVYPVPLDKHRPDLHPALREIIMCALAARPEDRFESAKAFLVAIHALVERVQVQLDALFARRLMGMLFKPSAAAAG